MYVMHKSAITYAVGLRQDMKDFPGLIRVVLSIERACPT